MGLEQTAPAPWREVSPGDWSNWKWQLANRLNTVADFDAFIDLTPSEKTALSVQGLFRVDITPYFASLIDPHDPNCPIRRQVLPTEQELLQDPAVMVDSLNEESHSPVRGLVHRYPDRVLMLVTTQCASYCRFCTRSRIVGDPHENFGQVDFEAQIDYIERTPQIRDVLLSGGDPLVLSDRVLGGLLERLNAIPHVEIVRINTRVPVFLPQRVTEELIATLRRFQPMWLNLHINHPKELTPELEAAIARLADAGIVLGCQSVLMAGVNDCPNVMLDLVHRLVRNRVRPYYLYQCDLVVGAAHFRTPVAKGVEIIEALRGHTSGYTIPTFVVDMPEGGGKVPVQPNYLISMSDERVVLRNYEGFISAYSQPADYRPHNPEECAHCRAQARPGNQQGVFGLLRGRARSIRPADWETTHRRERPDGS
ncbi:MAG: KamA family radical SAM protein [Chloroflexi bacterium]|nr:KamA family radical SAM protein [Chloroflexota bacterium]